MSEHPDYVALIPGGGWRVAYKLGDGTEWSEPVIGWAMNANGIVDAVTIEDGAGFAMADKLADGVRVYHPDADPELEPHPNGTKTVPCSQCRTDVLIHPPEDGDSPRVTCGRCAQAGVAIVHRGATS